MGFIVEYWLVFIPVATAGIGWLVRARWDQRREVERTEREQLQELERNMAGRRQETYWQLLDPIITAFAHRDRPGVQAELAKLMRSKPE